MVLSLVVLQYLRRFALVTEANFIDRFDAALPVSIENVARAWAMDIVLSSGEIPHEISPIHPIHLEIEEEIQVRPEGWFTGIRTRYDTSLSTCIRLVEFHESLVPSVPHSRERHAE